MNLKPVLALLIQNKFFLDRWVISDGLFIYILLLFTHRGRKCNSRRIGEFLSVDERVIKVLVSSHLSVIAVPVCGGDNGRQKEESTKRVLKIKDSLVTHRVVSLDILAGTTRVISALRQAAMRAILMFHSLFGANKTLSTNHKFEGKEEPKRNRTEVLLLTGVMLYR